VNKVSLPLFGGEGFGHMDTASLNLFVNEIGSGLGLGSQDIRLIAASILNILFSLVGILSIIFIIYGGFVWMTSGNNEEEIKRGQKVLRTGIIGAIIVLSSYSLARFILSAALNATGTYY
jgi:uncharacterized membrane protein